MMETIRTPTRLPTGPTLLMRPRTPPYTPPHSRPRYEPSRPPLTTRTSLHNVTTLHNVEPSSPLRYEVPQREPSPPAEHHGIVVEELSESDAGYTTDADTVYPHSLEEAASACNSDEDDDEDEVEEEENDPSHINPSTLHQTPTIHQVSSDDSDSDDASTISDPDTHTARLLERKLSALHCSDLPHHHHAPRATRPSPSPRELSFEEARRRRRLNKRPGGCHVRNFKRSHSQSVRSEPDDADTDAMAGHDVQASQRRLRRRVRGPTTFGFAEGKQEVNLSAFAAAAMKPRSMQLDAESEESSSSDEGSEEEDEEDEDEDTSMDEKKDVSDNDSEDDDDEEDEEEESDCESD